MQDFGELRARWDQHLARYEAGKSDIEAQIGTIRESMKETKGPLPDGFLSRLKSRVGRGVEEVKARKQVWDLERRLASSKQELGAEAARIRDQLLDVALARDINAAARTELARMPASAKTLDELRRTVAAVIQDLEQAAKAQDFAYNVRDAASVLQAKDAADKAGDSLRRLVIRLMQPPPGLGNGEWNQLGFDEFTSLNFHTFASNRVGEGRWMNTEMAKSMRNAIGKLKALDQKIGAALKSIAERRTSLSRQAMTAACQADADFGKLHEAVERW